MWRPGLLEEEERSVFAHEEGLSQWCQAAGSRFCSHVEGSERRRRRPNGSWSVGYARLGLGLSKGRRDWRRRSEEEDRCRRRRSGGREADGSGGGGIPSSFFAVLCCLFH
ncbi:hypothetical protein RJT34_12374 [Clitoria ternatea]|uniref:Uncharacterized protein n=1 Tax=Clitoria ternatea TaxID=43366 RepID=A0AAN9JM09_CLITE